jgi:hypothetical protein
MEPFVAICVPIYDTLEPDFWTSLNRLWKPSSHSAGFSGGKTVLCEKRGMTVEQARRMLTSEVLANYPDVTHLLWVDADMVFPPHALQRLLEAKAPIVGGLCHNRRNPWQPILGRKHGDPDRGYGWVYHYPPDALFPVDVTGAGFLLVERRVFERVSELGPECWWEPRSGLSEDFSFIQRAKECGFPALVDTGLEIGHIGKVVVDSDFARKNRPYEHEAWTPDPGQAMGFPEASIIIPTYNTKPRWLRAAILSASHQTVSVEVIVVDDGSDTPVPTTGWPSNVHVYKHDKNEGISAALNTGIRHMNTEWFAWLSADDLFDPRKIEQQLSATKQSGCKASFTRYQVIETGPGDWARIAQLPYWRTMAEQRATLLLGCPINGSTVLIHDSVFDDVGCFDTSYRYGQDWEMWCRIGQEYFWYCLEEILSTRRETENLTSAIEKDAGLRAIRDAEDQRIVATYRGELDAAVILPESPRSRLA